MNIKNVLILAVVVCVIQQVSSFNFCNCRDQGKDVCSCNNKASMTAPRPYPVQVPSLPRAPIFKSICKEQGPSPPQPFQPIGDACSCGKQIVKPAPLPRNRPACACSLPSLSLHQNQQTPEKPENCGHLIRVPSHYQPKHHSHQKSCNCKNQNQDQEPESREYKCKKCNNQADFYFETAKKPMQASKPRHPADVVSISLANRLAASAKNGVSERQLQYGSLKQPTVDIKSSQKSNSIKEENFYVTNGNILELQSNMFKKQESSSSSEEDSSEEKPKKQQPFNPLALGFDDIGYKTYESHKPRYVVVKNSEPVKHDCNRPSKPRHHQHHHKKSQSCDCYKDLVVDQSAISEQSMSFESANDHMNQRFST